MVYLRKRGAAAPEQIAIIIAAVIGLVVILLIYIAAKGSFLNVSFMSSTACWMSNGMKCGGGFATFTPNLCTPDKVEDVLTQESEELASLLRTTYWMYHKSKCDFTNTEAAVYSSFYFELEEDLAIGELLVYMSENNRGDSSPIEDSDLAYLEENTEGNTICFDGQVDEIAVEHKLKKEKTYYIHYWDRDKLIYPERGDRIIVTDDPYIDTFTLKEFVMPDFTVKGFLSKYAELAIPATICNIPCVILYQGGKATVEIMKADEPGKYCLEYSIPIGGGESESIIE
ncbi:hypothetical protein HOE91_00760 [archaeon]|nr:hypothetical protein [archaeon]MBT4441052.1 hypothetical protein [archaeon]